MPQQLCTVFVAAPETLRLRIAQRLEMEASFGGPLFHVRVATDGDLTAELQGWVRGVEALSALDALLVWSGGHFPIEFLKSVRETVERLLPTTPLLGAWHPDAIVRLPDESNPDFEAGFQDLVEDFESAPDNFRLQRLWLVGSTNQMPQRPGLTLDDAGVETLVAEAVVVLLRYRNLLPSPDARQPFASLGVARVAYDAKAARSWRAARAGASILEAYLTAPLDEGRAALHGSSITTELSLERAGVGLTASCAVGLLFQPQLLEPVSAPSGDGTVPTVIDRLTFDDLRLVVAATGSVEKTLSIPFAIMNHAQRILMREVGRIAADVTQTASRVEALGHRWLLSRVDLWARTSSGHPGLLAALAAVREALQHERDAVERARRSEPDWLTAIATAIARKLDLAPDAGVAASVDLDKLRDEMVAAHDVLVAAIEARPLARALLGRHALLAVLFAWSAAAAAPFTGPILGLPSMLSSPSVFAALGVVLALAPPVLKLLRYRTYLERCEQRLYAAALRYARGLVRGAILDEARRIFDRLIGVVGDPGDVAGNQTLYARAQRLREELEKAAAALHGQTYAPRVQPSVIQRCPLDEARLKRLEHACPNSWATDAFLSRISLDPVPTPDVLAEAAGSICLSGCAWITEVSPLELLSRAGVTLEPYSDFLGMTSEVYFPLNEPLANRARILVESPPPTEKPSAASVLRPDGDWQSSPVPAGAAIPGILALQADTELSPARAPILQQLCRQRDVPSDTRETPRI